MVDGRPVDLAAHAGVEEQRAELRAEDEIATGVRIEERLLPDTIAREEELFPARVPDGECEHAPQVLRTVGAVLLVRVDDGFGVGVAS